MIDHSVFTILTFPSQGAAALSQLNVSAEDRTQLFNEAVAQISRVLESESHERTLCVAIDALKTWLDGLTTTLPDKILDIFKVSAFNYSVDGAVNVLDHNPLSC